MLFSELYGNLLSPFVQKFKDAKNEKGRKTVVNNAADAVKKGKDLHEYSDNLPKDLKTVCNVFYSFHILIDSHVWFQAITRYIKACIKKESTRESTKESTKEPSAEAEEPKPKKVKRFYNIRDVVKWHYKSLVEDEIPYKSTDKQYLGSYQRAVTMVINNMSDEELEEAERLLELWNKEGGPSEVQLK